MKHTTPFYSQHWNLEKWKELGYASHAEAKYWESSCCGILCVKMIIDSFRLKNNQAVLPSVKDLIFEGVSLGAYTDENGWSHLGLKALIEDMGYKAQAQVCTLRDLKEALDKGKFIIASVRWAFNPKKKLREKVLFWRKEGGHLIVVHGYEEENGKLTGFYVHHTSSDKSKEWEDTFIDIKRFTKGFAGRGIVVSEK